LFEIAFGKIRVLPPVLHIESPSFSGTKAGIAQPDIKTVIRGIEISGKGGIGIMDMIGGYITADDEIIRQQVIDAQPETIGIYIGGAINGYGISLVIPGQ
jgi:hypothetical protein